MLNMIYYLDLNIHNMILLYVISKRINAAYSFDFKDNITSV